MYESPQLHSRQRSGAAQTKPANLSARRHTIKKNRTAPIKNKNIIKLLACAFIFSLISIVKAVYPDSTEAIKTIVEERINPGIDYKALVEALGQAMNGRGSINEVFGKITEGITGIKKDESNIENKTADGAENDTSGTEQTKNTAGDMNIEESPQATASKADGQAISAEPAVYTSRQTETKDNSSVDELSFDLSDSDLDDDTPQNSYVLPLPDNVDPNYKEINFKMKIPVNGEISSAFGYRDHPINNETKFHYGIDIAANFGTDVLCFADGTVESVGVSTVYGNYVRVQHKDGFLSFYGHLSKVYVKKGQTIKLGNKLGLVGGTGLTTGPHLHFEFHLGDSFLNPEYYIDTGK